MAHYKWNGSTWTSVSTLPYGLAYGCAVTNNGKIHILGGTNSTIGHYVFNGSTWDQQDDLPYAFAYGSAVSFNHEIHLFGTYADSSTTNSTKHYVLEIVDE